ncbi:MAG: hypothetical protein GF392_01555 [Candidatus Omnitrophica bacterium]|nr:hypothetical protein [Candidatus Omnitrophota bacterium]
MKKFFLFMVTTISAALLFVFISHAGAAKVQVASLRGDVEVMKPSDKETVECEKGMLLPEGTRVFTGFDSMVELTFGKDRSGRAVVEADSEVVIKIEGYDRIELIEGAVFTYIENLGEGETFKVETPGAVCGARGTAWLTALAGEDTVIEALQSRIFVKGVDREGTPMDEEIILEEGFRVDVRSPFPPGRPARIDPDQLSQLRRRYGVETAARARMKKKRKLIEARQRRMEGLRDKKARERIEDVKDKKEKPRKQKLISITRP